MTMSQEKTAYPFQLRAVKGAHALNSAVSLQLPENVMQHRAMQATRRFLTVWGPMLVIGLVALLLMLFIDSASAQSARAPQTGADASSSLDTAMKNAASNTCAVISGIIHNVLIKVAFVGFFIHSLVRLMSQQLVPASPTVPVKMPLPASEESQIMQLVDETGKLVAQVDSNGVVTVVPGELLSHAKNVLVTIRVGSATEMFTYPYAAPAAPAQ